METLKQIDYKKIFNLFTWKGIICRDIDRNMTYPFKQDGRYYATDAIGMIWMDADKVEFNFPEQTKPNCAGVIPKERHEPITINIDNLKSKLIGPLVDEYTLPKAECSYCEGDGTRRCDLGHTHDCEECDGTGDYQPGVTTGKQVVDPEQRFVILGSAFRLCILDRLIKTCELLGLDSVQKIYGEPNRGNIFVAGDVSILLMPSMQDEEYGNELIQVKL